MFWNIVLTSLAVMFAIMIIGELIEFAIRKWKG